VKNFVVVCLALLVAFAAASPSYSKHLAEEQSPFTLAEQNGDPTARCFFLFSTSFGDYVVRHDGMGEVSLRSGLRKVLHLKVGPKDRIHRLYSYEYAGDVLLLYETGESGYLVRLDQKTRKLKTVNAVSRDFEPPLMKDQRLVFSDGTVMMLN
jgi:hypothetical protein